MWSPVRRQVGRNQKVHVLKHHPKIEPLETRRLLTGVTYQGGPLIDSVAIDAVFLGTAWTSDPSLEQNATRLKQFFSYVTESSYLDMLSQYSTSQGGQIGRGTLEGSWTLPQDDWTASVIHDQTIRDLLDSEIAGGVLPQPNGNRLVFVFTPPNVNVQSGGEASNGTPVGFGGYHDSFTNLAGQTVYYAVIPDPIGNDRVPDLSVDDQQTMAASHELAESVTDPTFTSWWDDSGDAYTGLEIADFANPSTDTVYLGQYAVERVWSDELGGLESPAGATSTPSGSTSPPVSVAATEVAMAMPVNIGKVSQEIVGVTGYDGALISDAYQSFLGRSPDSDGMDYWIAEMQAGMSIETVDAAFLASNEYVLDHGGSNVGWLDGLYHDLLNRAPDTSGLQFWTDVLQQAVRKGTVALAIAGSFERESLIVKQDYQNLLGQTPHAALVAYWVAHLQNSANDAPLVAALIGSPEYYNDPAKGNGNASDWVTSAYHDLFGISPESHEAAWWAAQLQAQD